MPVNPVRIPLQWGTTTFVVQGKYHIPGKNSTILKYSPSSCVFVVSENKTSLLDVNKSFTRENSELVLEDLAHTPSLSIYSFRY